MMTAIQTAPFDLREQSLFPGFDEVISPLTREDFLTNYWGKSFVRLPGRPARFESLLPWSELNEILERHRLQPPRFRLFQDGKPVEPSRYLSFRGEASQGSLKSADLMNCLSGGATLVLDQVDELAPRVRQLAADFEDALRIYTSVNLYAGWRTQKGFDLHWDSQDTIILQLDGRKHWKVYRPTRLHPLKQDVEKPSEPKEDPVWDGILENGEMIYMPRGWWHVAYPLDEPSLHLTVTIVPAHGSQLLKWFVDQLKKHPEVRMDVPHLADAEDQQRYLGRLRSLLIESWSDDLLDQFLADLDAKALPRPHVRLPEGAIRGNATIGPDSQIRLAVGRGLWFGALNGGETVSFRANDTEWQCSTEIVPALRALSHNSARSVRDLCSLLPTSQAVPKLKIFLTALAMGGVLWVEA
jgi:ribosomal protein L16 Arg81 hydroxylase